MKKHKHVYDSDGGPCRICRITVAESLATDLINFGNTNTNWYEKRMDEQRKIKEIARKEEEDRINAMKCPSCQSTDKKHIVKSDSNGVLGPGYHSWIIDEYYVCNECGTMFKDLSKK